MQQFANKCIACSIDNCANHCANDCFCGLAKIQIGTHEANPTQTECTDCKNYVMKQV
ncbi:hypothetical protein FACS1894133_1550 [Clostridia bacterium]|nr:hypothetical protein FACS1894133_1550 [Clostridia bacterium]